MTDRDSAGFSEILARTIAQQPTPQPPPEPSAPRELSRNVSVLVLTALIALVALLLFWAVVRDLPAPAGESLPWAALVALFVVAELLFVAMRTKRSAHCVSLSEIPLVIGLTTVAAPVLVLARIIGSGVGLSLSHRGRGVKLAFNVALHGFEVCAAASIFMLVLQDAAPLSPRGWAAALAAVLLTDAFSAVLVTLAIVTHDGDRNEWRRLPRDLARGSMVAGTNTCVALVAALAIGQEPAAGLLLVAVAIVAYLAYRRYVTKSESGSQVERLYDFTSRLGGTTEVEAIVPITMRHVRDELRGGVAELIIPGETADTTPEDRASSAGWHPDHPSMGSRRHTSARRWTLTDTGVTEDVVTDFDAWWQGALTGFPVLVTPGTQRSRPGQPVDGMAVPLMLDDGVIAVLAVSDSLPDLPTYGRDELRLFQAMANHAAVALGKARLFERLRAQAVKQEHIALHDPLTTLPNRRYFASLLSAVLENSNSHVSVLLLDLNGFKDVNDTLGHDTGDQLLQEVGARLTSWLRGRGLVARLGGDEFAVLLTDADDAREACAVAEEIAACVAVPFRLDQLTLEVRASVGVAVAGEDRNARALLQHADVAMYAAKARDSGVAMYQPETDHNSRRRLTLLSSLRAAIEDGELYLHYQPKVTPGTGAVTAVEALVRWRNPEHGEISPDEFVSLAEQAGLVRPLTLYVLEEALRQAAEWRSRGYHLSVAVNVSTRNLLDARLPSDVAGLLMRTGTEPSALTLEITESTIMADRAGEVLERIADLGVELSVDDFGTGYSSLRYLRQLPVAEVKIDQSFVLALLSSRDDRSIVRAIVHLGHEMGLRVVAEGVEDLDTLRFLERLGCDLVQGYVYAQPLAPSELERWLDARAGVSRLVSVS